MVVLNEYIYIPSKKIDLYCEKLVSHIYVRMTCSACFSSDIHLQRYST